MYLGLFCGMGQLVTNQSYMISMAAYTGNWYQYPAHLKKYIIMIIAYSQQDYHLTAMGYIKCNLENYKKVRFSLFFTL